MRRKLPIIIAVAFIVIGLIGAAGIFLFPGHENTGDNLNQDGNLNQDENLHKQSDAISRYEWISLLGECFGYNEPSQSEPLWRDVEKENAYFKYVQAATEWDVITQEQDDKFNGEDAATGSFMVDTALKAIGDDLLMLYTQEQANTAGSDYINLLIQENLINEAELQEDISEERAKEFLDDITYFYHLKLRGTNAEHVVYKDGITQIPEEAIIASDEEIKEVTLQEQYVSNLKVGDFIVLYTTRGMMAKKVIEIKSENQLSLERAELDDVIDSMLVNECKMIGFDDIAKASGAEIKDLGDFPKIGEVQTETDRYQVQPLSWSSDFFNDFLFEHERENEIEIDSKGFEIVYTLSFDGDKETSSVEVRDHNTNCFFKLSVPNEDEEDGDTADSNTADGNTADGNTADGNKADGNTTDGNTADGSTADGNTADGNTAGENAIDGKEDNNSVSKDAYIKVTIDVSQIYLSTFVKIVEGPVWEDVAGTLAGGIGYIALDTIDSLPQKIDMQYAVKGSVSYAMGGEFNFRKKIVSIPLGGIGPILGANLNIYLFVGIDGSLHIKTEITNSMGVIYEEGKGVRKVDSRVNDSMEEPTTDTSVEADMQITPGVELQPVIELNGKKLIDLEVKISALLKGSVILRQNGMICKDGLIACPLLHLGVFEDDNIITDLAKVFGKKLSAGWDIRTEDDAPIKIETHYENDEKVPACTYEDGENDPVPEPTPESITQNPSIENPELKDFMDYKFGSWYYMTAPFEETWEGYKTQIECFYYPYISREELESLKTGDSFIVMGRKYTKGKEFEAFIEGKGGTNKDPETGKRYSDVYNPFGCCEIFDDEGNTYYIRNLRSPQNTQFGAFDGGSNDYDYGRDADYYWDYLFCDKDGRILCRSEKVDAIIMESAKIYATSRYISNDGEKLVYDADWAFTARQCFLYPITDINGVKIAGHTEPGEFQVVFTLNNAGFITELRVVDAG